MFLFLLVIKLNKKKKIFICCTEQSGENIVFNICKKLKKYNYQIDGVCGKSSEAYFTNKYYDISLFKSLGLTEIIFSIPKFIKIINALNNKILINNYDLIICVDSPDFNYHLAKKIKKNNFHKQVIQIVAPTVWAWRSGRAKKFSRVFNEIFTLFNFERKFFENEGLKSTFIGHPISIINESDYNNNQDKNLIAFLPGSRDNEINKLFPYLEYVYEHLLTNNMQDYKIFIPTLPHLIDKLINLTKNWKIKTIISCNNENNEKLYKDVFISVTCSGTASLEISKRMIPQIVFYKLNFLTYYIFSFLISIRFANILNILSNEMIIKEVVNRNLNKKNLLEAFDILLNDQNFRDKQISEIRKYLPEIQSATNPYDVCEKRITEIISITT
jgi:lipid-A-disaccharide synthase